MNPHSFPGGDDAARKRLHAGLLMLAGACPAEAARIVGVARQTAYKWKTRLDVGGLDALRSMTNGRPAQLDADRLESLRVALSRGALAHGYASDAWTPKRAALLIERLHGVRFSEVHVRRLLAGFGRGAGGTGRHRSPLPHAIGIRGGAASSHEVRW